MLKFFLRDKGINCIGKMLDQVFAKNQGIQNEHFLVTFAQQVKPVSVDNAALYNGVFRTLTSGMF